jgi:hypothetical protein
LLKNSVILSEGEPMIFLSLKASRAAVEGPAPTKPQGRVASQNSESEGALLARAEWANAPPTEKAYQYSLKFFLKAGEVLRLRLGQALWLKLTLGLAFAQDDGMLKERLRITDSPCGD